MSKSTGIGATLKDATTHSSQAVLLENGVSLFDFVKAGNVLCQITDIKIKSDLSIEDAKEIARGKKKVPVHDVIAKLDVLERIDYPIMPGSLIKLATVDEIINFLLRSHDVSNHIHLGHLLRREDVDFYLGGHFLNNHLAILGMPGTGKSTTGKLILSQTNWKDARVIVIDPHAEYEGEVVNLDKLEIKASSLNIENVLTRLRESIPDKYEKILDKISRVVKQTMNCESLNDYVMACSDEYVHGGKLIHQYLVDAIRIEFLSTVITKIITDNFYMSPLIINMKGLRKEIAQTLTKLIAELVLIQGKNGMGSHLFIDEAQSFAPQQGEPECKEAIIDLITEGRKFNCGVIIISQRPARVDKDVLSLCNSKIILKLTNENDIKQVRASTEFSNKSMFEEVQKLRTGKSGAEALVVSSIIERPVFIKIVVED